MRIGIVNDVLLAREALRRAVVSAPGHQVAWQARNGVEAVEMACSDRPDLILMDLVMPIVDGVEATRRIMAEAPCPILIVTASVTDHRGRVYEAMGLGALDAVDTPEMGPSGDVAGASILLEKIATIAKLIGRSPRPPIITTVPPVPPPHQTVGYDPSWPLIVMGASTGGPAALARVLTDLPDTRDAGLVIVQHLDLDFIPGLARWLQERTGRKVELAVSGDRPLPGQVLLAASNDHLIIDERGRFAYAVEPIANHFRPSVDVFFASAAKNWRPGGAAVLLTGMLHDGADGLLRLKQAGWLTIAQDQASSVVWGMPRVAVEMGAANLILPVTEIAAAIAERVRERSYRSPELSGR